MSGNGWQTKAVGEVCRLINGRAYKKSELLSRGSYRVLRVGNFFTNDHWYYSDLELEPDKYCDDGDLLYAWSASFGPRFWIGEKVIYHYHIWKVEPRADLVDRRFLFWFFEWDKEQIKKDQGAGTTMIHVSKGSMEARKINLPPLPEQRRIVGLLDEAFAAIATAKANTETNLRNARAVFESRLQGLFEVADDQGWELKKLEDIGSVFGRGKSRHRPRNEPKLYGGRYPFIQTGDVRNADRVVETYSQTYSEMGLAQSKLWPKGTVCITIAANIAETAILGFDACIPDSIIGLVVDEKKADNVFVLYLLRSFKAHLQAQGKGSAQHNINMGTFEDQLFPIPALPVQRKIVAALNDRA